MAVGVPVHVALRARVDGFVHAFLGVSFGLCMPVHLALSLSLRASVYVALRAGACDSSRGFVHLCIRLRALWLCAPVHVALRLAVHPCAYGLRACAYGFAVGFACRCVCACVLVQMVLRILRWLGGTGTNVFYH